jgi:hypothetical protein
MYISFLMSEPKSATCTRLAEIMGISHDSVNRFLLREAYEPKDLFNEAMATLNPIGGVLSVDDTTLDKPYSQHMERVGYFWSGKHHHVVKGVNLITLYYTDVQGRHQPVNYRVYDKSEGKTKNDYFRERVTEVLDWGLEPAFATEDSGYSCVANLKTVRNHGMGFLFAVESNRWVSIEKGEWFQVQALDIPEDGLVVWLRNFGEVKLFRTRLKDPLRHYVVHLPDVDGLAAFGRDAFLRQHDRHWQIEHYHRMIKQLCHIEHFQVRSKVPILNHLFAALCGYVHLQRMQAADVIRNAYRLRQDLFKDVAAAFVNAFIPGKEHLNPPFRAAVNA